ncbi:M28 family peptidase [Halorubrum sp. JWXQ-INN 858]|uniref:M28 family metallopeptidase n=1 Tax=Halorubrum sp. JWXQ-INN 858 TaxID=2690782 RepID=UPI001357D638|nr:M28 family metallopeptidase [Halorubrum sp. JWXQ-INN 858]MWV63942.1 M28 family peptidase [Halorubrum sp. JWXQ-INN 858]
MVELPDGVVGNARTSDFGWRILTDLTDIGNRMAGSAGERRGAERIVEAYEEAGLRNAGLDEFEIPGWWRGDSALSVSGPVERRHEGSHDVIALPGTPAGDVTAPLVDVGDGTYEEFEAAAGDLEGAIAMASSRTPETHDRWLHRMEKYVNAAEHGAIGFVFRNHIEGALPPTGEIGYHNRPGPIPAVGISKEVGARLSRLADEADAGAGDPPELTIEVDCRNEPTTSVNAVADVGPDTDEAVLLTAHVDAHDVSDGANDNGAGSALVAEVGRLLKTVEDDLDTRVHLITFGSEEVGLWGAYHAAETIPHEEIACVVNLDGACNSRNLRVGTNGFEEMGAVFESVAAAFAAELSTGDTISPHGDQWAFVQEGIPSVMTSTTSEQSGRGWGHTHADTLDKLDPRDLREVATLVAEATYRFASDDVTIPHRSREEVRDAIDDGYVQELRIGGRWPYEE